MLSLILDYMLDTLLNIIHRIKLKQFKRRLPLKAGEIIARKNISKDILKSMRVYRRFVGMTDEGYYIVQEFYEKTNNKLTDPFIIMQLEEVMTIHHWLDMQATQGMCITWHENGQKHLEFEFKDGIRQGHWLCWHENGQKAVEGQVKDGQMHGLWTYWYDNGQKSHEGLYQNDKEEGPWNQWDRDGNITSEEWYENDKLVSRRAFK